MCFQSTEPVSQRIVVEAETGRGGVGESSESWVMVMWLLKEEQHQRFRLCFHGHAVHTVCDFTAI